jgi:hypothetical protein
MKPLPLRLQVFAGSNMYYVGYLIEVETVAESFSTELRQFSSPITINVNGKKLSKGNNLL